MSFSFAKYQSAGNDFILIDARSPEIRQRITSLPRAELAKLCDRRFGVGADGLILLFGPPATHPTFDFEMKNYNSDGGECSMCGNGARALVRFAHRLGIEKPTYRFMAIDGEHEAKIEGNQVHLKMQSVLEGIPTPAGITFNTGSPHLVCKVKNLMDFDVVTEGRRIRNISLFRPSGININFVEEVDGQLFIRTYERGVEDETLSCGTGVIAAALAFAPPGKEVMIQARGGMLKVNFETDGTHFKNVWLIGPADFSFEGTW